MNATAWSLNGRLVALGSNDGTIRVWSTEDGKTKHLLPNQAAVLSICSSLRRSRKPVSERYPFGTSRSPYFWPFRVAVLLFGPAGDYSVYEGVQKFLHPHPVEDIRPASPSSAPPSSSSP